MRNVSNQPKENNMILIDNLIRDIIRNNKFKRISLIFIIIAPLFYINLNYDKYDLEPTSVFPISLLIMIGGLYIFTMLFKLFFELTSTEPTKEDVKPMYLFWTLLEFQIIFSILMIPFLYLFLNYFNQIHEFVRNILILLLISIYHLILVCIVGSRSRYNILPKIKIFLKHKKLLNIYAILIFINIIFQFEFIAYFIDYLRLLTTFVLFSLSYLLYITLIRQWQKIYFENEITSDVE